MNTFTATLRQDLRAQRWLLGAFFVFLLLDRAVQPGWFHQAAHPGWFSTDSHLAETLAPLFVIAPFLAWFFCLGRLVYTHAPNDDRVAWRTRPLNATSVGLTKLAFGLLLLVLLPALIIAIMSGDKQDASLALWWVTWVSPLAKGLLIVFGGLFFLCTLCRSSRELLITLAALAALLMLTISGLSTLGPAANRWTINVFRGLDQVPAFVLPAGLLVLAVRQYQRPRTLQHALLGTGWVLAVIAAGLALYLRQPPVEQLSAAGVTARVTAAALVNDGRELAATVEFTGLDAAAVWQLEFWSAPPRFPQRRDADVATGNFIATSGLTRELGLAGYTLDNTLSGPTRLSFTRLPTSPAPTPPVADLSYTFSLSQVALNSSQELPLPAGAAKGSDPKNSVDFTFTPASPNRFTLEVGYPDGTNSAGVMPYLALLVVDTTNRRAAFLPAAHRGLNNAPAGRVRQIYTATLPDWAVNHPGLKLRLLQIRDRGVMFLRGKTE